MTFSLLAFGLLFSYEVSRSAAESLFLRAYGAPALPFAWLVGTAAVGAAVLLYARMLRRAALLTVFGGSALCSGGLLFGMLLARFAGVPGVPFALFVWKDVHIVVLLEILWTFAAAIFRLTTARWVYGGFLALGSLAGVAGGLAVGRLARALTTEGALVVPAATLLALGLLAFPLGRPYRQLRMATPEARPPLASLLARLQRSRYLPWLFALVFLVQVAINLVDYSYLAVLAEAYPELDARTAVMGRINAALNLGSLILQALCGPILRVLGVPGALVAVPGLVSLLLIGYALSPRFVLMAAAKVGSKSLDYSLFKAAKEMLYIPLTDDEKSSGKAAIDMFAYRVGKGGASCLLLGLTFVGAGIAEVLALTFSVVAGWTAVTLVVTRRYRALVPRRAEMRGEREDASLDQQARHARGHEGG